MPKFTDAARSKVMLPLRVRGVDYPCNRQLAMMVVKSSNVSNPIWSHYPTIKASASDSAETSSDDPIVSPREVGGNCTPQLIDCSKSRFATSGRLHHVDTSDESFALLKDAFDLASKDCRKAKYLTPAQLIRATISVTHEKGESSPPSVEIVAGHLRVDLSNAQRRTRYCVAALLYLLRDLAYLSSQPAPSKPQYQIAMSGRPTVAERSPVPYTPSDPKLVLGSSVPQELRQVDLGLPMHCLAVGASGVGKTWSFVIPRLKAHLAYKLHDGTPTAALIVDPKRELASIAESYLALRGEKERMFLAGRDGRVRLYPRETSLSLHDRVTEIFDALGCSPYQRGDSGPWVQKSIALLLGLIDAHAVTYNRFGRDLFVDLMREAGRDSTSRMGYWSSLRDIVRLAQEGAESVKWLHHRLMSRATASDIPYDERVMFRFLERYASMDEEAANQISYVTGHLEGPLATLCDTGLTSWLDMTPVPEMDSACAGRQSHDIGDLIDQARAVVFQPPDSHSGDIGTRLVKAQIYRAAMHRTNLRQPVLFLADEFQRYVTSDRESGEANLLDRCRAFRITTVLATQSVSALYDALSKRHDGGDPKQAVHTMMGNIGHAIFFQTCDEASTDALIRSWPVSAPHGWPHPLSITPLSSLHVGEAYYVAPQGQRGRTRFGLSS